MCYDENSAVFHFLHVILSIVIIVYAMVFQNVHFAQTLNQGLQISDWASHFTHDKTSSIKYI